MIGGMNSHYLPKYLEHFWKAESLSDHFIGWKLSFLHQVLHSSPSLAPSGYLFIYFKDWIVSKRKRSGSSRARWDLWKEAGEK